MNKLVINKKKALRNSVKFIERDDLDFTVESQLGLVIMFAKIVYRKLGIRDANILKELIQEGSFGLMYAYAKYDKSLGYTFSAYSRKWILSVMNRFLIRNSVITFKRNFVNDENEHEKVSVMSLDVVNDLNENPYEKEITDIKVDVLKQSFFEIIRKTLNDKIEKLLKPKEKLVIEYRYFKDESLTEVGSRLNISKQRSHQIEKEAIDKLKEDREIQNLYPLYMELLYS